MRETFFVSSLSFSESSTSFLSPAFSHAKALIFIIERFKVFAYDFISRVFRFVSVVNSRFEGFCCSIFYFVGVVVDGSRIFGDSEIGGDFYSRVSVNFPVSGINLPLDRFYPGEVAPEVDFQVPSCLI